MQSKCKNIKDAELLLLLLVMVIDVERLFVVSEAAQCPCAVF
jgi:hypothetical protein